MTAAVLHERPEDPRAFLAAKLEALRQGGREPHNFSDDDLATLFGMFDPSGSGAVSAAQAAEAIDTLTGDAGEAAAARGGQGQLGRDAFLLQMRAALRTQIAAPVAPSR